MPAQGARATRPTTKPTRWRWPPARGPAATGPAGTMQASGELRHGPAEASREALRKAVRDAVDRQLRVGSDAGREQRAVVDRKVVELPVRAVGPGDAERLAARQAAAAHDVGADDLGEQRLQRQRLDRRAGLVPAA